MVRKSVRESSISSLVGYKIEKEDSSAPISDEPDSSSFDTYDEYDDGIEDDVF